MRVYFRLYAGVPPLHNHSNLQRSGVHPLTDHEPMNNHRGFTLIELLLAMSLSMLVLSAAYVSFSSGLDLYRRSSAQQETFHKCRSALTLITKDLQSAFMSPNQMGTLFVGEDNADKELALDRILFMSVGNQPRRKGFGESDIMEVEYYIDTDPKTPEQWLQRRTDATPDDDPYNGGTILLAGKDVAAMDCRYFDGSTWLDSWDSKEKLPNMVWVSISTPLPKKRNKEQRFITLAKTINLATCRETASSSAYIEPAT